MKKQRPQLAVVGLEYRGLSHILGAPWPLARTLVTLSSGETFEVEKIERINDLYHLRGENYLDRVPKKVVQANDSAWEKDFLVWKAEQDEAFGSLVTDEVKCRRKNEIEPAGKIIGHPAAAIVHWMGSDSWLYEEVVRVLSHLSSSLTDRALRANLRAGKRGIGDPLKLTVKEQDTLYKVLYRQ